MGSSQKDIDAAYDNLDKAFETIAAMSCDVLTATEKQRLLARLETHRRRLPAVEHPLINQLGTECARNAWRRHARRGVGHGVAHHQG